MNILEIGIFEGPSLKPHWVPTPGSVFSRWEVPDWQVFLDTPNDMIRNYDYDFLVLFPSCSVFSLMSVNHHWKKTATGYDLITEKAKQMEQVLRKMEDLTRFYKLWMIENPRSIMRSFWSAGTMHYITHCAYQGLRMKPTNIWMNFPWESRPPCSPMDFCHKEGTFREVDGVLQEVIRTRRRKTRLQKTVLPRLLQESLLEAALKAHNQLEAE
jgi:hypothetical protein